MPIKMTERYFATGEAIDAVATYSDYSHSTVATDVKIAEPAGPFSP